MSTPRQPQVQLHAWKPRIHHHAIIAKKADKATDRRHRFNNKSLNWPSWFRHFRAVADVHGWDKSRRALQLASYLDETAMNVAQELGDDELYDYDILVKLLGDRFDLASRVSASRSRFHGRLRRHHEDADSFADAITELCRIGYPQSSPELRQELISEQFIKNSRIQNSRNTCGRSSEPKRTGNCRHWSRFAWISPAFADHVNIHRPAEQVFAVEEDDESEDMFAMMDRSQWTGQGVSEPNMPPSLQPCQTLYIRHWSALGHRWER